MSYTYILECKDKSFYVGSTYNLDKRLWEHDQGIGANYTKKRLPVRLVYCEQYDKIEDAFFREKQIQGWGRKKKLALMNQDYGGLVMVSKSYSENGKPIFVVSDKTPDFPVCIS